MQFYFPININKRRLHFFNLKDTEEEAANPDFSFIIKNNDSPCLLSIDTLETPRLISGSGANSDVILDRHCFAVEEINSLKDGVPTYKISIKEGRPVIDTKNTCFLKAVGYTGSDDESLYASVSIDSTQETKPEFIVIVSYSVGGKCFEDAVTIYLYNEDDDLVSGALDFGSEASQIRFNGNDANTAIIDTFLTFSKEQDSIRQEQNFWQGRPGDKLYKSVFFVNLTPGTTKFGEKPKVGQNGAFVWPLMSNTNKDYSNLELLPNLKLIEIGQRRINYNVQNIAFGKGSDIEDSTLSSQRLRDDILRLILSNFLHCLLKRECCGNRPKWLRMVVLVPNVYYQSKIYSLMLGLYKDYYKIQHGDEPYPQCKGLEVQVVSESDASFIGVKHTRDDIKNATNGYFLIIDAGKGTTDFSILQQKKDFSKFDSLCRDGIPASGNVLTYAFYEALHNYMRIKGIDLVRHLRKASKAELLEFTNHLENLKYYYQENQNVFAPIKSGAVLSLTDINTYLQTQIVAHRQIPLCVDFVNEKVEILTKSIHTSLNNYMSSMPDIKFIQVLLSGRGFLFEPFKQSVIDMLVKNKWMDRDAVIRIEGNEAKTICLEGAISVEKECSVNCNSGLIGNPVIRKTADYGSYLENYGRKLLNSIFPDWIRQRCKKKIKGIDMDFFYSGSAKVSARNVTVTIGGRKYHINSDEREAKSIYYIGDGFLCQKEDSADSIQERNFSFADPTIENLVLQSMFPFTPESILDSDAMPRKDLKENKPMTEETSQSSVSPQTSGSGEIE